MCANRRSYIGVVLMSQVPYFLCRVIGMFTMILQEALHIDFCLMWFPVSYIFLACFIEHCFHFEMLQLFTSKTVLFRIEYIFSNQAFWKTSARDNVNLSIDASLERRVCFLRILYIATFLCSLGTVSLYLIWIASFCDLTWLPEATQVSE